MRNVKTREGYDWWDKFCALQRYSFLKDHNELVRRVPMKSGNWIDVYEAQEIVDQMQDEINDLRGQVKCLKS